MAKTKSRRSLLLFVSAAVVAVLGIGFAVYWNRFGPAGQARHDKTALFTPAASPELAKFKGEFLSGIDAVQKNEGAEAVRHLSSFSYGSRPVEEYRLYYLANAYRLTGDVIRARQTLSRLWVSQPRLLYRQDAAFSLASLYDAGGFFRQAAETFGVLAGRTENDTVSAAAREGYIEHKFYSGDPGAILFAARKIAIENPKSSQARPAIDLVRRFETRGISDTITLSDAERVERIDSLIGEGDPQSALGEAAALDIAALPSPLKERLILDRGTALHLLHRYADSDKAFAPLFSGYFKYAIPALDLSVKNNTILAASINPISFRTVRIKQQVGTVKVRTKSKKVVTKPKFKIVSKQEKVVNLALQIRKDAYQHAAAEHLNDLLRLPLASNQKREVLLNLIARAQEKNQDAFLQTLVSQLVKIEPGNDTGLQHFWTKGWEAYEAGDLKTAASLFDYISSTYESVNIRRQVTYWTARLMERQGKSAEAKIIYDRLANAPYEDLYAVSAQRRGAKRTIAAAPNPLKKGTDEWPLIADKTAPPELRMAYELGSLGLQREAQLEVRANLNLENSRFANAILGEIYYLQGASVSSSRALRMAFPKLATVEQDSVPARFIKMDFPLHYEDHIRKEASRRGVDPYLVMALIRQESVFNPEARSGVGARGLMQLMPPTARELSQRLGRHFSDSSLTDPDSNIDMGVLYVKQLLDRNQGNIQLTAACYNAGIGNVANWRRAAPSRPIDEFVENIPFVETRGYVKRVTFYRSAYERFSR